MQENIFKLKQFQVSHGKSTMKVGTDAMLLGAWLPLDSGMSVLEVGCGCGIISLMLAQRNSNLNITAIDIDEQSVIESSNNFNLSPWHERLLAERMAFKEMALSGRKFDLIVSNPPYFQDALLSPDTKRNRARHQSELGPKSFFLQAASCSNINTFIALIFPHQDFIIWNEQAQFQGFYPKQTCEVIPATGKKPVLNMVIWSQHQNSLKIHTVTIRDNGVYTSQYRELLESFLIIF